MAVGKLNCPGPSPLQQMCVNLARDITGVTVEKLPPSSLSGLLQ